ncbi:MAG: hypothetical protein ACJ79S_03650 [Gemmatimonadaceae bacterium]
MRYRMKGRRSSGAGRLPRLLVPIAATLALTACVMARPRALAARELGAPVAACLPAGAAAQQLAVHVTELVTRTDAATVRVRDAVKLLSVSASAVTVVADERTCQSAANAYQANLDAAATTAAPPVYVIAAGPKRYVVWNPGYRVGEFGLVAVMDNRFNYLSGFTR